MKELNLGARSIFTGSGSLSSLNAVTTARAFIVTGGSSMFKNGTIAKIEGILKDKQCETLVYSGISKNPDTAAVLAGLARMRDFAPDTVIAVGGGSPLDAAKVMALMYEYPELTFANVLAASLPARREKIQLIAIPSTSGTASEVTRAAVVTFRDKELKIGLKTNAFIPDIAILDPQLTLSMPPALVAETGMDAMTHALECYLNINADEFTTTLAVGAVEGILTYLPLSYRDNTLEAREKMHYYQCIAGVAFANAGLGAVHGIAHALGGKFDMAHGLLNAIGLPYVLSYNSQDALVREKLERLARRTGQDDIIGAVLQLNKAVDIPGCLNDTGLSAAEFEAALPGLVENSLKGSTAGNPVRIDAGAMRTLLLEIFYGREF